MIQREHYKDTQLQTSGAQVKVFWNSCFLRPIYVAASLELARRWVDAYRAGEHWAVETRLPATKP